MKPFFSLSLSFLLCFLHLSENKAPTSGDPTQPANSGDSKLTEKTEIGESASEAHDSTLRSCSPPNIAAAPLDLSKACEKEISIQTEALVPEQSQPDPNARCKSPAVLQKATDARHFQKTRSFSAVEETHEKKVSTEQSKAIAEFLFKDVAHSRSEQLETAQQQAADATPTSSKVRPFDTEKDDSANDKDRVKAPKASDETLIMQFDYFSNDQPMSLQHDSTYNKTHDKRNDGCSSNLRKSGRDLTELEAEVARDGFGKTKTNRINSRPRLECYTISPSLYRSFSSTTMMMMTIHLYRFNT